MEGRMPIRLTDTENAIKISRDQIGTIERVERPRHQTNSTPCKYAVSDGSVKQGRGNYGWVTSNTDQMSGTSKGTVQGIPGNMTSFCVEAQGLMDMIQTDKIDQSTNIFLDNTSIIDKVTQPQPLYPMQAEWELLEPIHKQIVERRLKVHHVRGHGTWKIHGHCGRPD